EDTPRPSEAAPSPHRKIEARIKDARPARAPKLAVRGLDGCALHITGRGLDRDAPVETEPLDDAATLFELIADKAELRILLRIERTEAEARVTIGAPRGSFYAVSCNGDSARPTPRINLVLKDALRCDVSKDDGGRCSFELDLLAK